MPKTRRRARWSVLAVAALWWAAAACAASPATSPTDGAASGPADPGIIEVHRSITCECCGVYESYLAEEGFTVQSRIREDLPEWKESIGVPLDLGSCHTSLVGGYFVEGHVPAEAIRQLLAQRPAIDGIALPGMPAGSPGMPGPRDAAWVVYAVAGDEVTEFGVW